MGAKKRCTFGRSMANCVNRSRPPSRSSSTRPWDWLSPMVVKSKPEGFGVRNRSLQSSASVLDGESKATRKCWLPSKLKVAASAKRFRHQFDKTATNKQTNRQTTTRRDSTLLSNDPVKRKTNKKAKWNRWHFQRFHTTRRFIGHGQSSSGWFVDCFDIYSWRLSTFAARRSVETGRRTVAQESIPALCTRTSVHARLRFALRR